jgi:hypothetical protein
MSDADVLFEATWHGDAVTVTHATVEEIAFLSGPVGDGGGEDLLELWSLIAIRNGPLSEIHGLGWRLLLANTWITSPVVAANMTLGAIRTESGKTYLLGARDKPQLDPELRRHLAYALRTWGFEDVSP